MDFKDRKAKDSFISRIQGMVEKASHDFDNNKLDDAISTLKVASKEASACGKKQLNQLIFPNLLMYMECKSALCFEQADVVGGMGMIKSQIEVLLESDYSDKKEQIELLRSKAVVMIGPRIVAQSEDTAEVNAYLVSLKDVFDACEKIYPPDSYDLEQHRELFSKLLNNYTTNFLARHSSKSVTNSLDGAKRQALDTSISFESQNEATKAVVDKYTLEFSRDMESGHIDAKAYEKAGKYAVASHMYNALAQVYDSESEFDAARKAFESAAVNALAVVKEKELQGNIRYALYWNRYAQDLYLKASSSVTAAEDKLDVSLDYIAKAARLLGKDNLLHCDLTRYKR